MAAINEQKRGWYVLAAEVAKLLSLSSCGKGGGMTEVVRLAKSLRKLGKRSVRIDVGFGEICPRRPWAKVSFRTTGMASNLCVIHNLKIEAK